MDFTSIPTKHVLSPKLLDLISILENATVLQDQEPEEDLRIMIFTQRRCTAKILTDLINSWPSLKGKYSAGCLLGSGISFARC